MIKPNQWYRFETDLDQLDWLCKTGDLCELTFEEISAYMDKEVLLYHDDTDSIRYRTRHNLNFEPLEVETYRTEDNRSKHYCLDELDALTGGVYHTKERGNNMINCKPNQSTGPEVELIDKAYQEAHRKVKVALQEANTNIYQNTVAYNELTKAMKIIAKHTGHDEYDITQSPDMLSEVELDSLAANQEIAENEHQLVEDNFLKLRILFSLTETYEQRVQLLKDYGII